jgi:hypothetical protein
MRVWLYLDRSFVALFSPSGKWWNIALKYATAASTSIPIYPSHKSSISTIKENFSIHRGLSLRKTAQVLSLHETRNVVASISLLLYIISILKLSCSYWKLIRMGF